MIITPNLVFIMLLSICAFVMFDLFFTYKLYSSVENHSDEWDQEVESKLIELAKVITDLQERQTRNMKYITENKKSILRLEKKDGK